MWRIIITTTFKQRYKQLNGTLIERVDEATRTLTEAENPLRLGEPKKGRLRGAYGYPISRACRILYTLDWDEQTIHLLRVCAHKQVYR
ncbi:type II toxin-antitoxin system mRNA interferase toxin, RelE/StbE family [Candidatus Bathyarchaeota archaeon]|nr:type II toxin-antitoxin system mRNA interferase toxin, RelE/StbE family [Candidatus Bathyarchaeota archaeon]MBS7629024.1 type II toxin-antitoxin system mRNA interferase toxin, RelE/StbE family [Candidatus Bathyarchaeota archaeon]